MQSNMKTLQRSYFRDAVLVELVFLCSEICGEGIRAANHLHIGNSDRVFAPAVVSVVRWSP